MGNKISIGVPYMEKHRGGGTYLCADTVWSVAGKEYAHKFYYLTDSQWAPYLVTERIDPWVQTFLEIAMEYGCDMEFTTPISEDIKYQFERYLIPVLAQHYLQLHEIRLIGPAIREALPSENVTGTGFSGGVDSFYSVLSHLHTGMPGKDVTHLLLAVNGAATTGISEELDEQWYQEEMCRFRPLAEEMGLNLIGVRSNITATNAYRNFYLGGDSIVTLSFVRALGKLFSTYYWASTYKADVLRFDTHDGGYMEPFSVPMLSGSGIRFYHSGAETNRMGKVKAIADEPIVQKGLTVCGETVNCGRCTKCLRTMAELTAVRKLDQFEQVFPVADYKAHFTSRLADEFAGDHPPFTTDIKRAMRENGVRIPVTVYIKQFLFYEPYNLAKKKLRRNPLMIRLYYRTSLGRKLSGVQHSDSYIEARMSGQGKERHGSRR